MVETLQPVTTSFNRSLRIEHRPERLTGDPGAVVLREVLERSGIVEWMVAQLGGERLAVPFGVIEVLVRLHEVPDREEILALVNPRAAPDDLLELDHRPYRAHQHDVAHIPRIDPGRQFLRCGQDCWDGLFVVLKVAQVLIADGPVIRRDAHAIAGVCAGLNLVDQIAH